MTVLATTLGSTGTEMTGIAPIVIDLGKKKKGRIKDLKRGGGRLMAEVAGVLSQVQAGLGEEAGNKQLVPVVLIYKKKTRRRRNRGRGQLSVRGGGGGGGGFFPFNFPFILG